MTAAQWVNEASSSLFLTGSNDSSVRIFDGQYGGQLIAGGKELGILLVKNVSTPTILWLTKQTRNMCVKFRCTLVSLPTSHQSRIVAQTAVYEVNEHPISVNVLILTATNRLRIRFGTLCQRNEIQL